MLFFSGGIKALNFCVLDTSMPKIVEVIIASLLRLHNDPELRLKAKVNLGLIVAPYTEFTYIHQHSSGSTWIYLGTFYENNLLHEFQPLISTVCLLSSALATGDKQDLLEEREKRFKCAEHAFLCTMRSWSGLCQMCQSRQIGNLKYIYYTLSLFVISLIYYMKSIASLFFQDLHIFKLLLIFCTWITMKLE